MSVFLRHISKEQVAGGYRELVGDFNKFVELARDVADEAESWRDYDVGNIGCSLLPESENLATVQGANLKIKYPHVDVEDTDEFLLEEFNIPRDVPKVCAEMATSILSAEENHSFIAMINAASNLGNSVEEITGVKTATLPPCEDCTKILDRSVQTGRATLYISAGLETEEAQIRNMRTLKKLHTLRIPDETPVIIPRIILANKALEIFDRSMQSHVFQPRQYPSRVISSLAKAALMNAATELDLVKSVSNQCPD